MKFIQKLEKIAKKNNSLLCVGLDPIKYPFFQFNKSIIDQTYKYVCAYKPNSAFYEAQGAKGIKELKMTFDYLNKNYPEIITILDAKRGDIGSTNKGYVKFAFDYLKADAVTLHPYLGKEALQLFLDRADKGCIILCRTSNYGAAEFQDLSMFQCSPRESPHSHLRAGRMLYEIVAQQVAKEWNTSNNCLLVVGATYPNELKKVREIVGEKMWLLVPGIGAQGGDIEKTVKAGQNKRGTGIIINSSRAIIFAKDPQEAAQLIRDEINKFRKYAKS